jgi:hypothetical protein
MNCCILFPKYAKTHIRASAILKIFLEVSPRTPVKGERKEFGKEREREISGRMKILVGRKE